MSLLPAYCVVGLFVVVGRSETFWSGCVSVVGWTSLTVRSRFHHVFHLKGPKTAECEGDFFTGYETHAVQSLYLRRFIQK